MSRPYPRYYMVKGRPAKVVRTPAGGLECLVYDDEACSFAPHRGYLVRVLARGLGGDVEELAEEEFERLVEQCNDDLVRRLRDTPIEWYFSFDQDDETLTFRAIVNGTTYKLRARPPGQLGYTLLVYGRKIADIASEEWPTAWEIVGFGKRRNAGSAEAGPAIEAEQIRTWAERLCRSSGGPAEMAEALGLEGTPVDNASLGYATMEPPPHGTSQVVLSKGRYGVDYVRLEFSNCVATRAQLDSLLGEGMNVPAVHPSGTFKIAYYVEVPGAPFRCSVFVDFEYPDIPESLACMVTLRRDPVGD